MCLDSEKVAVPDRGVVDGAVRVVVGGRDEKTGDDVMPGPRGPGAARSPAVRPPEVVTDR